MRSSLVTESSTPEAIVSKRVTRSASKKSPVATVKTEVISDEIAEADPSKATEDFFWTYTEEPHRTRRQAIIKAHPEVTNSPFGA
jgi:sphingolipid 4-desaturase/C4-monooxygenase